MGSAVLLDNVPLPMSAAQYLTCRQRLTLLSLSLFFSLPLFLGLLIAMTSTTIGKMVFRLRVLRDDGSPLGYVCPIPYVLVIARSVVLTCTQGPVAAACADPLCVLDVLLLPPTDTSLLTPRAERTLRQAPWDACLALPTERGWRVQERGT